MAEDLTPTLDGIARHAAATAHTGVLVRPDEDLQHDVYCLVYVCSVCHETVGLEVCIAARDGPISEHRKRRQEQVTA